MSEKHKHSKEYYRNRCGKTTGQVADSAGMLKFTRYRCGHRDCEYCKSIELDRRKKSVVRMLGRTHDFHMLVVPEQSARGLKNKIRGSNYYAIPKDGQVTFILDKAVRHAGFESSPVDSSDVMKFVSREENVYTDKKRSTGGMWSLSERGQSIQLDGEIEFERLIPFFDVPHDSDKQLHLLNELRAAANVWTGGKLDPANQQMVQSFVDHVSSAYCEMAIREGFQFNTRMSYVRKECVSIQAISKWVGISLDPGGLEFFNDESEELFSKISPHIIPLITGNKGIKNWRTEFRIQKYGAQSFEEVGIYIQ